MNTSVWLLNRGVDLAIQFSVILNRMLLVTTKFKRNPAAEYMIAPDFFATSEKHKICQKGGGVLSTETFSVIYVFLT